MINVIIPMAGHGSRFSDAGYFLPKLLLPVIGEPMIEAVINNLNIDGKYIFIIQRSHSIEYGLDILLKRVKPECEIIMIDEVTEGPACTALLAKEFINNDTQLVITNCDQIINDFDINKLIEFSNINKADGVLGAFISNSNKNSYMKLDTNGKAIEIKEKIVISNIATNGLHYWKHGKDFISSAERMIEKDDRYNNEFYIAPTYNYMINNGKTILPYFYNLHFPIGTPEDLIKFKEIYENI